MRLRRGLGLGLFRGAGADRRRRAAELAGIEAEITSYGEALDRHSFSPGQPGATDEMRADLVRALDAYEEAKQALVGDRDRADALDVLRALDEGRHALACLDARLAGGPPPERLPLCFFDARHGRSTTHVSWAPDGGAPRNVAVCAADAVRIAEGREPITPRGRARTVSLFRASEEARGARGRATAPPQGPERRGGRAGREVSGRGDGRHRVVLPEPGRSAVLVLRTERPAHITVRVDRPQGRRPRGYQLHSADGPVVARIPLSRGGGRREVGFQLEFRDGARERWSARTEPLDAIPAFDMHIDGQGFDVVRYQGAAGPGMLRHRGRGAVVLQALDHELAEWATVAEGNADSDVTVTWPGPGYYQVRAHGAWSLTQEPDS
ncbi:hypothetical protein OG607_03460 [Streptomyces sp. NBC_01537]|uniref:hypothetical protein n=1 Tax=Streptomyces sp. NBC_01537 TaxID=2903896 RepID=UPI00386631B2